MSEQQPIDKAVDKPKVVEKKESLATWKDALVKAEPKFLAINDKKEQAKIELGFAAQLISKNKKLQECSFESILDSVINVARTGITLNPVLKLAHLIPRDGVCVLEFDYKGLIKILKDNHCVKDLQAHIVYEDEGFEEGSNQIVAPLHKKVYAKSEEEQKKRKKVGVYCSVVLPDNTVIYTPFMPAWEIEKTKNTSKSKGSEYSPWNKWEEEMWKKTKIKRDFKTLISGSPNERVSKALEIEEENNGLEQKYLAGQNRDERMTEISKEDIIGNGKE